MSSLREQFNAEAHAVPALGDIDAALAQVAKERRRLRRVGTAAVAAVVLIGWLVTRPEVGATPPPASTFTPTPTASPAFIPVSRAPEVIPPLPAARFALEDPVVRADPGHHSAWVVATLRNDSEHRLFIGGQFLPITGGDYVQRDSADPYLPVVGEPVSTADGLAARDGTLEDVRAILDRYQRGVGQPTAAPGGRIAVIMRVTSACTASLRRCAGSSGPTPMPPRISKAHPRRSCWSTCPDQHPAGSRQHWPLPVVPHRRHPDSHAKWSNPKRVGEPPLAAGSVERAAEGARYVPTCIGLRPPGDRHSPWGQ